MDDLVGNPGDGWLGGVPMFLWLTVRSFLLVWNLFEQRKRLSVRVEFPNLNAIVLGCKGNARKLRRDIGHSNQRFLRFLERIPVLGVNTLPFRRSMIEQESA